MTDEHILRIEAATNAQGDLIGYRLTVLPSERTLLVFADQADMPGFRLGEAFVSRPEDLITYTVRSFND